MEDSLTLQTLLQIVFDDVSFAYGEKQILHNVSFTVKVRVKWCCVSCAFAVNLLFLRSGEVGRLFHALFTARVCCSSVVSLSSVCGLCNECRGCL